MKNFRDIESLSAYLDGQLNTAEAARLETRLKTDPELDSILSDLRAARGILRKLPARKAPRNFTLTRQMVGLKPPMPRSYPLFRLATIFASILFLFSFTANALSPMFSLSSPAPESSIFGMGGGCDGPCEDAAMEPAAAAESAPAAEAATEEAFNLAPQGTAEAAPIETEAVRIAETPAVKEAPEEAAAQDQAAESADQPTAEQEAPASFNWTILFLAISILGGISLWVMRRSAQSKWH